MLRSTVMVVAALFAAGVLVFVVTAIVTDDLQVVEYGSMLLFPFSTVASFAVLVALVVESKSVGIAWRAAGWWIPLTFVFGFVWLMYVSSFGMALSHSSWHFPRFSSEIVTAVLFNTVFVVPQALVPVRLWRRFKAADDDQDIREIRTTLTAALVLGVAIFVPNALISTRTAGVSEAMMVALWSSAVIILGFLCASPLLRWSEEDSFRKRVFVFPAIVGGLCLLGMYFGPAGFLASLLPMLALSFGASVGVRAVDRVTRGSVSN